MSGVSPMATTAPVSGLWIAPPAFMPQGNPATMHSAGRTIQRPAFLNNAPAAPSPLPPTVPEAKPAAAPLAAKPLAPKPKDSEPSKETTPAEPETQQTAQALKADIKQLNSEYDKATTLEQKLIVASKLNDLFARSKNLTVINTLKKDKTLSTGIENIAIKLITDTNNKSEASLQEGVQFAGVNLARFVPEPSAQLKSTLQQLAKQSKGDQAKTALVQEVLNSFDNPDRFSGGSLDVESASTAVKDPKAKEAAESQNAKGQKLDATSSASDSGVEESDTSTASPSETPQPRELANV